MSDSTPYPITLPDGSKWKHTVYLKDVIDHPNIEVDEYTYYNDFRSSITDYAKEVAPYLHPHAPEKLTIGKFVQIAHGVQFITSSANHSLTGLTTYPFFIFDDWKENCTLPDLTNKGDTVIGHDTWIGHKSTIMPGVKVGTGVIIGSCSVVTKDLPDYCIAAGNPAKVIKMRFNSETIQALTNIQWWNWPIEVIRQHIETITAADIKALLKIHSKIMNN